jgi:pyrroloquinoline quinone (PQQ) biosynthesis protein C
MTATDRQPAALPGDTFVEDLERLRMETLQGRLLRQPARATSKEEVAESRRRTHRGGANVVKRNSERYLNCPVKRVRRLQLRKLVDEAGEDNFPGGEQPSHQTLDRWESHEFGLTDAEIDRLEKEDPSPESLIVSGWWMYHHRTAHWAVAMGGALVGEGEKRNPEVRKALLDEIEHLRQAYTAMGVADVERALISKTVHAGVDVEHANFDADVIRDHVTTPALQQQMRDAFLLTIQKEQRRDL